MDKMVALNTHLSAAVRASAFDCELNAAKHTAEKTDKAIHAGKRSALW